MQDEEQGRPPIRSKMNLDDHVEPSKDEDFPFPLTAVDRHNLSITDAEYQPHTWEELKRIIGAEATRLQC